MLKTTIYKSSITTLLGFSLAVLFALVLAPAAHAESSFDATDSNLSTEHKEQINKRLQDAQMRITELREKNKTQIEELRKKAEERIKELQAKASLKTDDKDDDSLDHDRGNTISDAAKQMRSDERSALFGAIIERLQKIDTERGDNNPMLKTAIEQLQKLQSQIETGDN